MYFASARFLTCGEAYRSRRAFRSVVVCHLSSFDHLWLRLGHVTFPGKVTPRESWLPGKVDFPGKLTSRESWLPGKVDFPEKLTPSGKVDYLGQSWLPREKWTPSGKVLSETFSKINRWNIGAAGSKRTFPSCLCSGSRILIKPMIDMPPNVPIFLLKCSKIKK